MYWFGLLPGSKVSYSIVTHTLALAAALCEVLAEGGSVCVCGCGWNSVCCCCGMEGLIFPIFLIIHCSVGFSIEKLKTWQLAAHRAEKRAGRRGKGEGGGGEASWDLL